jgi:hypothetical protein
MRRHAGNGIFQRWHGKRTLSPKLDFVNNNTTLIKDGRISLTQMETQQGRTAQGCFMRKDGNPNKSRRKQGKGRRDDQRQQEKRKRESNAAYVKSVPPAERPQVIRNAIRSGELDEETQCTIAVLAKQVQQKEECKKVDGFGKAWLLLCADDTSRTMMNLILNVVFGEESKHPDIEGYKVLSAGSPWLLETRKTRSSWHNDIFGQETRELPGSHMGFFTLFYCVEGSNLDLIVRDKTYLKYDNDNSDNDNLCTAQVVQKIAVETGKWVIFPARLLHEICQREGETKSRLVISLQFRKEN